MRVKNGTPCLFLASAVLGDCLGQKPCGQGFLCWQGLLDHESLAQVHAIFGVAVIVPHEDIQDYIVLSGFAWLL